MNGFCVFVSVSVDCEDTIIGGSSIPVNRSAVVPIPMRIPIDRYLKSVCIAFAELECIIEAPFDVDNPCMLSVFSAMIAKKFS